MRWRSRVRRTRSTSWEISKGLRSQSSGSPPGISLGGRVEAGPLIAHLEVDGLVVAVE
jgi:hypothetical protein